MKNKYVSISILKLFLILGMQEGYAQSNVGEVVTSPIASPSMASLSRYSDIPINEATGIPNISVPLLNVPLADNSITYPISLNYNIKNYENAERISDVGYGWSLIGTSVIYKKVIGELDECYDNPQRPGHINNEFDDVYYYVLPGVSGKFKIKRDVVANTFKLINLSPNNAKIEYVRNSNTATFKADNFTVTTDDGYKYYFQEFDYGQYECSNSLLPISFKSSYFLTKIVNPIGIEMATLDYEKKNDIRSDGKIVFQYCKLKSIKTVKGEVTFGFTYDDNLKETVNDPYTFNKITLKNPAGEVIYNYVINNTIPIRPYDDPEKRKRILNSVSKNDRNNTKIEETLFFYNNPTAAQGRITDGVLEKMALPTGGVIQYNYENNEQFFDYNDPDYLSYLDQHGFDPLIQAKENILEVPFDTQNKKVYSFTIPGDVSKTKKFELAINLDYFLYPIPPQPDPNDPLDPVPSDIHPALNFTLKKGSQEIWTRQYTNNLPQNNFEFSNNPGDYTLEVSSQDEAKGIGNFQIVGLKFLPGPYRNSRAAEGERIKNIKYYKSLSDPTPERILNYGYDAFTGNSSSGFLYFNERDSDSEQRSAYILYKNVKVFENGKGYIQKTFKTPNDFPKYHNGGTAQQPNTFWPYYNITKDGLPYREDIFDDQNKLLVSKETNYDFDYYSNEEYNLNLVGQSSFSKPAYIKRTTQIEKIVYPGGRVLENQSETKINNLNFKPDYIKSIVDGNTKEKFLNYPLSVSGYSHLENAYMVGVPIAVQEKVNNRILSGSTTLFSNSSLLPTSVIVTNIADGSTKESLKMDQYDDRGNLIQFTNSGGLPTAMIYGYNKTAIIAKVEGATYNQISLLVNDIINASNSDNLNSNTEPALITALDNFRKLPALANYQITTYTYDPLVGITSITPPSCLREMYEYDLSGRLKRIKRMEKNSVGTVTFKTLKEYQYNYKQ